MNKKNEQTAQWANVAMRPFDCIIGEDTCKALTGYN